MLIPEINTKANLDDIAIAFDEVYPVGKTEMWEDDEDKDPRGHVAHVFRAKNFSKPKRAKNRKVNKLAKKARRK